MAFHEQFAAFPGGFLGVDVFFVLSGYLITDLLVTQRARYGRLDLRGFWVRRARRLLPALAVVLVTVTAAVAVIEPGQLGALRPALLAAASYSSNWWQAVQHQSYFAGFGPPPPLQHLWSLAIEEQFYLVWPLILAVTLLTCQSRRLRAGIAWLGAALSAVAMALFYVPGGDPSRVYYGTDTHASALLIGAALAFSFPLREVRASSREQAQRADVVGLAGIAVLAWSMGHFSGADSTLYPAGLIIAALGAGGLVVAAASPGTVSRMLSWAPLRWIGIRSYGIYLWHWPVFTLMAAATGPQPAGVWIWVAETTMAIGLAAASWRWIEEPIIRNGFGATLRARYQVVAESLAAARQSPVRAFPVVALVAALTVACTAGYGVLRAPDSATTGLQQQISQGAKISAASQRHGATSSRGRAAAGSGSSPRGGAAHGRSAHGIAAHGTSAHGATAPRVSAVTPAPSPGSTAQAGAQHAAVRIPGSKVTAIGDSVMLASAPQLQAVLHGIYIDALVSRQVSAGLELAAQMAARGALRPVVVFGLGTNGTFTGAQMHQLLAIIGPHRKLVLLNTYVPRPWQNGDNRVIAAAARHHANVVLANWYATIEHRTSLLYQDDVHPQPPGARLYARLVASAVQATGRIASPWPPPLPHPIQREGLAG